MLLSWVRYTALLVFLISSYYLYGYFQEKRALNVRKEVQKETSSVYQSIGGYFTLIDQDGNEFSSDQLNGKPTLLYFGFTFCPDICPESLGKLMEVKAILEKYQIPAQIVFITIDPKRDTPAALKEYLTDSYAGIIGLTGSEEAIRKVADKYRIYYTKSPQTKGQDTDYLLDHSALIYVLNKEGKVVKHFGFGSLAEEIVEYMRINYKS